MFNLRGKDEIDRFFGSIFNQNGRFRVDITEDESNYLVEAELPGVSKENINVEYKNDILSIHVKENESISKERLNRYSMRNFSIPNISFKDANASYKEGLLKIILPKKEYLDEAYLINIE